MGGSGAEGETVNFDLKEMAMAKKDVGVSGGEAAAAEERKPLQEPDGGWPADEYTGKPGSYSRDPFTGVRTPADDVARKANGLPVADAA